MNNRRVAQGLTMALISAVAAISMPTGVQAASDPKPGKDAAASQETDDGRAVVSGKEARTKAEKSASAFVAADPAALKLGAKDEAVRLKTYQSSGLQYVSYDRNHQGLRVVGGDFVVAADAEGNLLGTSVAQDAPVKVPTTKPAITEAKAEKVAKGQVTKPAVESSELVIVQGESGSDLAYETIVTGTRAGEPSRLSVFVDAATGKVLSTKEHVVEGTGNSGYSGSVSISTQLSG
ncbi:MAG TPA: PepSY domain-containing protein, partial [Nocardioides sp.]